MHVIKSHSIQISFYTVLMSVKIGSPNSWHLPAVSAWPDNAECSFRGSKLEPLSQVRSAGRCTVEQETLELRAAGLLPYSLSFGT